MAEFLTGFSNILWGAPVLILLGIVGLLYGIRTKFFQIRKMGYILKNTAGEMFKKGGGASGDRGTLTPLQAVCSALAGCVGTANRKSADGRAAAKYRLVALRKESVDRNLE